ncbi:MAG: recombinase family protein [Candidatus Competibacteraceae bacterium]|nr:recombinase family protein [Candidatus Competibacteraceae bacterium]
MLLGYLRVSKADGSQTTDLQRDALTTAGVRPEHLYEDLASGTKDDRPGLAAGLKALRAGDVLVVWKLDRLGRNLRHLVNLVHDLTQRGVGLKVVTGHGAAVDTTTPAGKLVFGIFATLAEFERAMLRERTRNGLDAARQQGRIGGRRPKLKTHQQQEIVQLVNSGQKTAADAARLFNVHPATLSRLLRRDKAP